MFDSDWKKILVLSQVTQKLVICQSASDGDAARIETPIPLTFYRSIQRCLAE